MQKNALGCGKVDEYVESPANLSCRRYEKNMNLFDILFQANQVAQN